MAKEGRDAISKFARVQGGRAKAHTHARTSMAPKKRKVDDAGPSAPAPKEPKPANGAGLLKKGQDLLKKFKAGSATQAENVKRAFASEQALREALSCPVEEGLRASITAALEEATAVTDARRALAQSAKRDGNDSMGGKSYGGAVCHYSRAIDADPTDAVLYANRSASHAALADDEWQPPECKGFREAVADASKACALRPTWPKAHSRLAYAYFKQGEADDAEKAYRAALALYEHGGDAPPSTPGQPAETHKAGDAQQSALQASLRQVGEWRNSRWKR